MMSLASCSQLTSVEILCLSYESNISDEAVLHVAAMCSKTLTTYIVESKDPAYVKSMMSQYVKGNIHVSAL